MPDPYVRLSFAIIGESQDIGVGTGAFGGAAAGLVAGAAGAAAAGFAGLGGVGACSEGVLTSACTEPEAVAFTPPGTAGFSADGFESPSGGGGVGDLVSSGIPRLKPTTQRISERTLTFISLGARCQRPPNGIVTKHSQSQTANHATSALSAPLSLILLNQIANALRIRFAVSVTRNRIRPARRFNHNFRPHHARRYMHRRDFRNCNRLFIAAEES